MLYNKERKEALFIEVKSSIGSVKELLEDFDEAKKTVIRDFNKILADRIGNKLENLNLVEFIILLPREQSLPVKEKIRLLGVEGIIIWELSAITSSSIEIFHEISNIDEMKNKKQTHQDDSLREKLYAGLKLVRIAKMFNFLLNSDPYQKIIYFITLFKNLELKDFNFTEIKNRILDGEICFEAYINPEKSKEFVYSELINSLTKMKKINILKRTDDILTTQYEILFDKRAGETFLKNIIDKAFFQYILEEKEVEIKTEALDRFKKYAGQSSLP